MDHVKKNLTVGFVVLLHEEEWIPVDVTVEMHIRSIIEPKHQWPWKHISMRW